MGSFKMAGAAVAGALNMEKQAAGESVKVRPDSHTARDTSHEFSFFRGQNLREDDARSRSETNDLPTTHRTKPHNP